MTPETQGQRLRRLREDLDMSQTDFAAQIGCKQSHLSGLENDNATLTIDLLQRLFDEFKYNPLYHITGLGVPIIDISNMNVLPIAISETSTKYNVLNKQTEQTGELKKIIEENLNLKKEILEKMQENKRLREKMELLQDKIITLLEKTSLSTISSR